MYIGSGKIEVCVCIAEMYIGSALSGINFHPINGTGGDRFINK